MEDLISKKEVLEQYGISYGALYRWKRMGLIPEAWFIRKSTTTGQETFFRRDQKGVTWGVTGGTGTSSTGSKRASSSSRKTSSS